jgi:hypothetical protein
MPFGRIFSRAVALVFLWKTLWIRGSKGVKKRPFLWKTPVLFRRPCSPQALSTAFPPFGALVHRVVHMHKCWPVEEKECFPQARAPSTNSTSNV